MERHDASATASRDRTDGLFAGPGNLPTDDQIRENQSRPRASCSQKRVPRSRNGCGHQRIEAGASSTNRRQVASAMAGRLPPRSARRDRRKLLRLRRHRSRTRRKHHEPIDESPPTAVLISWRSGIARRVAGRPPAQEAVVAPGRSREPRRKQHSDTCFRCSTSSRTTSRIRQEIQVGHTCNVSRKSNEAQSSVS